MADDDTLIEINFTHGRPMVMQSNPAQIMGEIERAPRPLPLIELRDQRGEAVWINANHIRDIRAHKPRTGAFT